jgi:hypothetical protein
VTVTPHPVAARDKALRVNLDPRFYGTCAEIGAGQEVVRWFFHAGAAAGTIAKSISQRGDSTAFFSFADTVSARSFRGNNECHGWMGVRFQTRPGGANQQIVIHVRMLDLENAAQQNLLADGEVDLADFVSRADVLATTGHTVMISDFAEYYRLAAYLFRYTQRRIGLAMGAMNLVELLDEAAYHRLDAGILYLMNRRCIVQLTDINQAYLNIYSHDVLSQIGRDSAEWETMVPPKLAAAIKARRLFGYS